jgi:hypothetical protein
MKFILFSFFICITFSLQAQNRLVFTNSDSSQKVTVKQHDLIRLGYDGYMNQPQESEGNVSAITDSSISLSPRKKFLAKRAAGQTILVRDVTGFRKYSKFRPAAEIIYGVLSVGITGAIAAIISSSSKSTVAILLSTAATGAVTTALKNAVFSHKIKDKLANGWTLRLMNDTLQSSTK